jgi:hypothetical protein
MFQKIEHMIFGDASIKEILFSQVSNFDNVSSRWVDDVCINHEHDELITDVMFERIKFHDKNIKKNFRFNFFHKTIYNPQWDGDLRHEFKEMEVIDFVREYTLRHFSLDPSANSLNQQ